MIILFLIFMIIVCMLCDVYVIRKGKVHYCVQPVLVVILNRHVQLRVNDYITSNTKITFVVERNAFVRIRTLCESITT